MRVNVYAEEMTDRIQIINKEIEGSTFTGLRLYLELPATVNGHQYQGPFMHSPGDDDSSAVTFWGKRDLRLVLRKMLGQLDAHYAARELLASYPPDWYDGNPKPCPGSGRPVYISYHGECDSFGERLYRASCKECGQPFPPGTLPEHTFMPMDVDNVTFTQGSVLEGIEITPDPEVPGRVHVSMPSPVISAEELAELRANVKRMIAAALRKRSAL